MKTPSFIAVEGPIGVGKTSLAAALARHENSFLLKEIVDENPFLHKFYEDIEEWSFQTEMFFLCNRYKQLQDAAKEKLAAGKPIVADYHVFKNLIFARMNLPEGEYAKYEEIYRILTKDLAMPDRVIYLTAGLDTLLSRIEGRSRKFESKIDPAYLESLSENYDRFIARFEREHPEVPVVRINTDSVDFVNHKKDLDQIITLILKDR